MAIPAGIKLVVVIPCDFIPSPTHLPPNPPQLFGLPESGETTTPGMNSLTDVELAAVKQLVQLSESGDDGLPTGSTKNQPSDSSTSSTSFSASAKPSTSEEKTAGKRPPKRRFRSISTLYRITSQINVGCRKNSKKAHH